MNYYDNIASGYEELHKEEQLAKISLIKKYFNPQKNKKLLDVGCGSGISTVVWNCDIAGIDPSKELIKIAKQKKGNYYIGGAENLPFKDNEFDYVISLTAIQNFDDIDKGLKEIKRVGKDKFILTFLKASLKKDKIKQLIYDNFKVEQELEEDKDLVFICEKS
jgi:ubiquinone/menaquinone biosynthesis C-methylase UbiE